MKNIIDIHSKGAYPSNILSNFAPNAFILDSAECGSMEGFLQSLKVKKRKKQITIWQMTGKDAKAAGKRRFLWRMTKKVYWNGIKYNRFGEEYHVLLKRAYSAMFSQNEGFRNALNAAEGYTLIHSIGKQYERKTILTEREFIDCLTSLMKASGNIDSCKLY